MNEIRITDSERDRDVRELVALMRRVEADPNTRIRTSERVRIDELLEKLYKDTFA